MTDSHETDEKGLAGLRKASAWWNAWANKDTAAAWWTDCMYRDIAETTLENTDIVFLALHSTKQCQGQPCTVHNRSDHHMRSWPQNWRPDRMMIERICPHGIGHPDPDELVAAPYDNTVHGCDGCCDPNMLVDTHGLSTLVHMSEEDLEKWMKARNERIIEHVDE